MNYLPIDSNGCPFLILAPMEGIGDRSFRKAMASIGGYNEGVTEFLRVPLNAHVKSLARDYNPEETSPIPLAVQIMGSEPEMMALMAQELERKGAKRIDLNCGCPSNTVTGKGAGSSLLKDPERLHNIAKAMVKAVSVPVTVKMRSGYEDYSRLKENLLAAQESGIAFLTLHPRTKIDGYGPPAKWELIALAKEILSIPLVGNGDILTPADAHRMLQETGCDALMIGRGAITNPFIFHQIRASFAGESHNPGFAWLPPYFENFISQFPEAMTVRSQISKLKAIMGFLFKKEDLLSKRQEMLRATPETLEHFLELTMPLLQASYS